MKKFKKAICLLLVLFTLLTSNLGCVQTPRKKTVAAKFTIYFSEDSSVEYYAYSTDMNYGKVSVPQRSTGYYYAKYEVYYQKTKEVIGAEDLWYHHVSAKEVKETTISDFFGVDGRMRDFGVVITVEDTRVTPTLVIDPAGAIEYAENERYVYKYTGENCLPEVLYCMHDGEILHITESRKYLNNNKRIYSLVEVGVYQLRYCVVASAYVDEKYQQICAPINVYITVEIIE